MSKEEILKEEYSKLISNPDKVYQQNPSIIKAALSAMDIHAIAFGNFIRDSLYVHEGVIRIKPEIAEQFGGKMNTTTFYSKYQQQKGKA